MTFPYGTGTLDYRLGLRRAFLCAKETNVSSLSVPTESIAFSPLDIPLWLESVAVGSFESFSPRIERTDERVNRGA